MKHALHRLLAGLVLLAALAPALADETAQPPAYDKGELLDRIVAVVNDDVITENELELEVAQIVAQLRSQNTRLPPPEVLRRQILDRMVLRRIQLQLARRAHITVDDETLNRTLESIARQNGLDLLQFRDVLERQGMSYQRFRENLRDEITINRLQKRQVHDRINISQDEVEAWLANRALQTGEQYEYELGHILISVPEAASPEAIARAREKARRIVAELRDGADFAQTAVAESDGRQALEGGSLGWREASALPTLFADWVKGRETGEISDPIRSPSGFHIIKLLDRRSNQPQLLVTQTHARHILVSPNKVGGSERARQKVEELKLRIENGEDFAELARANSDDPGSGAEGGDLGWVNPGTMVEPFEKAMDATPVGQISDPVQTRFGWHIIEVLGRREQDRTEEMKRQNAMRAIRAAKLDPAMQAWLRRLRDEAYVEIRL